MTIPSISDLHVYTGTLLDNDDWDFNFDQITDWLTDGTADLTFNSFTVDTASSMGNAKLTNLADPTAAQDAATKSYVDSSVTPRGYIDGYILSNNSSSPNTDLDIAAGVCQNSTNEQVITHSISYTKKLNVAWAPGTNQGMLDTGSIAGSTWYHIYAIYNPTSDLTDILASTSATNPTLPTGYTKFRRIGSVKTNSSAQILGFYQKGDLFIWKVRPIDRATAAAPDTNAHLITISAPLGVETEAKLVTSHIADAQALNIQNPYETDVAVDAYNNVIFDSNSATYGSSVVDVLTNSSAQVCVRTQGTNNYSLSCISYKDFRGKE